MLRQLGDSNLPQDLVDKTIEYLRIRNQVVHEATMSANKNIATDIVKIINGLVKSIRQEGIVFKYI